MVGVKYFVSFLGYGFQMHDLTEKLNFMHKMTLCYK